MKKLKIFLSVVFTQLFCAVASNASAIDVLVQKMVGGDTEAITNDVLSFSGTTIWIIIASSFICFGITGLASQVAQSFGGAALNGPVSNTAQATIGAVGGGLAKAAGRGGKAVKELMKERSKTKDAAAGLNASSPSAGAKDFTGGSKPDGGGKPASAPDGADPKSPNASDKKESTAESPDGKTETPEGANDTAGGQPASGNPEQPASGNSGQPASGNPTGNASPSGGTPPPSASAAPRTPDEHSDGDGADTSDDGDKPKDPAKKAAGGFIAGALASLGRIATPIMAMLGLGKGAPDANAAKKGLPGRPGVTTRIYETARRAASDEYDSREGKKGKS